MFRPGGGGHTVIEQRTERQPKKSQLLPPHRETSARGAEGRTSTSSPAKIMTRARRKASEEPKIGEFTNRDQFCVDVQNDGRSWKIKGIKQRKRHEVRIPFTETDFVPTRHRAVCTAPRPFQRIEDG